MWYAYKVKKGKKFKEYSAGQIVSVGSVPAATIPPELDVIELGEDYNPNEQTFDGSNIQSIYYKDYNSTTLINLQKSEGLIK